MDVSVGRRRRGSGGRGVTVPPEFWPCPYCDHGRDEHIAIMQPFRTDGEVAHRRTAMGIGCMGCAEEQGVDQVVCSIFLPPNDKQREAMERAAGYYRDVEVRMSEAAQQALTEGSQQVSRWMDEEQEYLIRINVEKAMEYHREGFEVPEELRPYLAPHLSKYRAQPARATVTVEDPGLGFCDECGRSVRAWMDKRGNWHLHGHKNGRDRCPGSNRIIS